MHSMGWFGAGWFMMFWWIILILAIAFVINLLSRTKSNKVDNERAADILEKRYARGEITLKEFEKMKRNITLV